MSTRTFKPVLTRRAAPGAPKPVAHPTQQPPRAAGSPAGTPRFASAIANRTISQRNDRWEAEAHRTARAIHQPAPSTTTATAKASSIPTVSAAASAVSRSPAGLSAKTISPSRPPPLRLGPREHAIPATAPPAVGATPLLSLSTLSALPDVATTAQPLSVNMRRRLESFLGADLASVRVHTGPAAHHIAESVHARAFTIGNHIYLSADASPTDFDVLAHETTHVVQQSATLHAAPARGPPQSRSPPHLTAAPRGMIQRLETPQWLKDAGNAVAHPIDTAGKVIDAGAELVAEGFWAVVDKLAPTKISELLHDIKNHGFLGVLKTKVSAALDFVFTSLKAQGGTAAKIGAVFETLIARAKPILSALAAGDCKPLFAAVKSLGDILGKMAGEAWDKLTTFLKPVGDWLSNVWNKFGAPVVDFLKEFAADTWTWIKDLGQDLWDLTAPVRKIYSGAWTEIKNLLGFGEGSDDDGSGGVVGWIKEKAGEVWDGIKTEFKPVIDPIKKAATAINDFLPIQDILNLREKINEWMDKATAMADNMDQPDDLAENKDLLHDIVLPGIKRAIVKLRGKVVEASIWAATKIGGLVGKVTDFFTTLSSNTLLSPLKGVIQWLNDEAVEVGAWATEKVAGLFSTADQALVTLDTWLEPVFKTLGKLIAALSDLMGHLGDLVLGPLLLVPKCIRDPIKDFVVTKILSQIPVFAQLVELPAIWAKVAPAFRAVVVSIFRDGKLLNAAWIFFRTALELLGVPPQLLTNLIRNAAKAIKDVIKDPVGFLCNVLQATKLGLLQFIDNIGKHLLKGAVDWLLSGVKGPGIKIPDPFVIDLKNVLSLVLQVLDLTMEKVFQRIEKKQGKTVADRVRQMAKVAEKALEWISVLINEGPSGLWKYVEKQLSDLWTTMLKMVVDFLVGKIVQQATIWVTKTLASGGLSVILDAVKAVYDALQVVKQYMTQMLEVANSVCEGISDIAKGVLTKGANMVESAAARLIPMVLAFLAKTLGIGDLPVVIGEGIKKVRKKVEDAIDTLIDKTFAAIDWAKQKLKQLKDWWDAREDFTTEDGEPHYMNIEGEDSAAKIVIHSDLVGLDDAVARIAAHKDASKEEISKAQKLHGTITTIFTNMKGAPVPTGTNPTEKSDPNYKKLKEHNRNIRAAFREITPIFAKYLFGGDITVDKLPKTQKAGVGEWSTISANRADGQDPGEERPDGWEALVAADLTVGRAPYFKRLHLINENFGGGRETGNLVPGTTYFNNVHKTGVENPIKELIGTTKQTGTGKAKFKGVVWIKNEVTKHPASASAQWREEVVKTGVKAEHYTSSINVTWGIHERKDAGKDKYEWPTKGASGSYFLGPMPLPEFRVKDVPALKKALK